MTIHVGVKEWRGKSFVQGYRVMRGDELIMECDEERIIATLREDGADGENGVRAVPIPPEIRRLCE